MVPLRRKGYYARSIPSDNFTTPARGDSLPWIGKAVFSAGRRQQPGARHVGLQCLAT